MLMTEWESYTHMCETNCEYLSFRLKKDTSPE